MIDNDKLKDIMFGYFQYRMDKAYPLCHEVTSIALALVDYGFEPTEANIAQVDFFLQREHLYPEVYAARLRAAKYLGNDLDEMYKCLLTEKYQNKTVLEEPMEEFEL